MDEKERLLVSWLRPSGGLIYHLRARRSKRLWSDFASDLEKWLNAWPLHQRELILIGPSAGYTLPTPWLSRFALHAYDVDPLAPWMFRRRHRLQARFSREDVFWRDGRLSTAGIREVLKRHPEAAILFCNVLGQLPLEHGQARESVDDLPRYLVDLRRELEGREWASYHDLYSTEDPRAQPVELTDHLTGGRWLDGLETLLLPWRLTENRLHMIQCVRGCNGSRTI